MSASSLSNRYFASTFAISVLPTPVGPKKMNEPIGREGSFNPARVRWIALVSFTMASSCPITLPARLSFILRSFCPSFWLILFTGTPLIIAITEATSSSTTSNTMLSLSFSHSRCATSRSSIKRFSLSRNRAASSKRCFLTIEFFSALVVSISSSSWMICFGTVMFAK